MIYDYLQNVHVCRMVTCGLVCGYDCIIKTPPSVFAVRQSFTLTRFVAVLSVGII